jgi:FtsZ-interacting cell division protein YlmF
MNVSVLFARFTKVLPKREREREREREKERERERKNKEKEQEKRKKKEEEERRTGEEETLTLYFLQILSHENVLAGYVQPSCDHEGEAEKIPKLACESLN